jgi:hypothetical protein
LFLSFLFSDPGVGIHFLKDVWLFEAVWCAVSVDPKYPGAPTLILRTVTNDDVERSHPHPHAVLPRQSGTFHGFSKEFNVGFVPHVQRGAHTNTIESTRQHVKAFLNPYSRLGDYIYHLAH